MKRFCRHTSLFLSSLLFIASLCIVSCSDDEAKEARWRTTENGIKLFYTDTLFSGKGRVTYEWDGPINRDSLAHGEGTLITRSNDGEINKRQVSAFYGNINQGKERLTSGENHYFGDCNNEQQSHGFGVQVKGPMVFVGDFKDGEGCGKVHAYKNDTLIYDGRWEHGLYEGYGVMFSQDGRVMYYGGWKEGLFHGDGTRVAENGMEFRHIWHEGKLPESTQKLYARLNDHFAQLGMQRYVQLQHRYYLYEAFHVALYIVIGLFLLIIGYVYHQIKKTNYEKRYTYKDPIDPKSVYPYWFCGGLFGLHRAKLFDDFGRIEFLLTSCALLLNAQNIFLFIDSPSVWFMLWHMSFINIAVTLSALLIALADVYFIPYNVYVRNAQYYRKSFYEMDILEGKATDLEIFCQSLPEKFVERDKKMEEYIQRAVDANAETKEVGKIQKFFGGDVDFAQKKFGKIRYQYNKARELCRDTTKDAQTLNNYLSRARLDAYRNLNLAKDLIRIIKANSKGKIQELQEDADLNIHVDKVRVQTKLARYSSSQSIANTLSGMEKTFTNMQKNGFSGKQTAAVVGIEAVAGLINIIADRNATRERLAQESLKVIQNIRLSADQLTQTEANILRAHELLLALFNANKAFVHAYTGLRDQVYGDISFKSYRNGPLSDRSILDSEEFMQSLQHLAMVCSEYNKINQNKIE